MVIFLFSTNFFGHTKGILGLLRHVTITHSKKFFFFFPQLPHLHAVISEQPKSKSGLEADLNRLDTGWTDRIERERVG